MKVVIATPFYEVKAFSPYISCLMLSVKILDRLGIEWDYLELSGDSYIDRARDTLAAKFLQDKDATHLIFIDSDMGWTGEAFANLLKADADIVGAGYPCKNNWDHFSVILDCFDNGTPIVREDGLLQAWGVPTGFCKISRKVFEAVKPNTKAYGDEELPLNGFFERILPYGEDMSFMVRAKRAGFQPYCVPDCTMSHYGVKSWTGNYHEYLMRLPGGCKSSL